MNPHRGEIWWVNLDPTRGSEIKKTRPCIILGTNILNQRRRTVVIVPLSTAPQAALPLLVPVQCAGKTAVAVTDQIRAVAKERLHRPAGELAPGDLARVEEALRTILEL